MYYIELNQHLTPTPDDLFQIAQDLKEWKALSAFPVEWNIIESDPFEERIESIEEELEESKEENLRLTNRIDEQNDTITDLKDTIDTLRTQLSEYDS